jgi:hypothetical protein
LHHRLGEPIVLSDISALGESREMLSRPAEEPMSRPAIRIGRALVSDLPQ